MAACGKKGFVFPRSVNALSMPYQYLFQMKCTDIHISMLEKVLGENEKWRKKMILRSGENGTG